MEKLDGMQAIQAVRSSKQSTKCDPGWLADKIKILFSSYRLDQYPEPKSFLAQVGMVLEQYDAAIVAHVTSPLTGIQRKCKFPPSIAEVVEECERVSIEMAEAARRRATKVNLNREPIRRDKPKPGEDYDSMFKQYGRPIGRFE